jgi:protein-S-isoprenylcysteine O-methyltransferase Ste14
MGSVINSPLFHFASGALLAELYLLFVAAQVVQFTETGDWSLLVFCIAQTLAATFLFIRTPPRTFSQKPHEWLIGLAGTFAPLLLRPTPDSLFAWAHWGLIAGTCIEMAAIASLNRSLAVVPALRELKTGGMYRLVRHPIYASYFVTLSFYVSANFSWRNALVCIAGMALLLARMRLEEAHLGADASYRAYRQRVRWRVIPYVY